MTWSGWYGKVPHTAQLDRVLALPRRTEPPKGYERLSGLFSLGEQELRPVQAQALAELHCMRGLFAPIRVGGGKTLITYLAPHMVSAERPLLLVPARLREKTLREFEELEKHWRRPDHPTTVLSYETFSREGQAGILDELLPDLIMADESHHLKNVRAACTRRVGRYMRLHPDTPFVALSGTMTKRSLMDFAHIIDWCLEDPPIPIEVFDLEQWSRALDEESNWYGSRIHPGALEVFYEGEGSPEERARRGYRRRLVETPGVVATDESPIDASLVIDEWKPRLGLSIEQKQAFKKLADEWELPDGTELLDAIEVWRHALELSQGFYYRWAEEPPKEWMRARKAWAQYCRASLRHTNVLDTEAQLKKAREGLPVLEEWEAIRPTYTPKTEPVWLTSHVVEDAVEWVRQNKGLCWVGHRAVGEAMKRLGVRYFGARGMDDGVPIEEWKGGGALSIAANAEGRNLQHYSESLILSPPTTGDRWEQLLGRTHREGQVADTVYASVYLGCKQARSGFERALSDAKYQRGILGSPQKLLIADVSLERS